MKFISVHWNIRLGDTLESCGKNVQLHQIEFINWRRTNELEIYSGFDRSTAICLQKLRLINSEFEKQKRQFGLISYFKNSILSIFMCKCLHLSPSYVLYK